MPRALSTIALDIRANWPKVSPHAKPYLDAMRELSSMDDYYFCDTADSVVRYFLSNASGWRGEHAKRVKEELKSMLK